MFQRRHVACSWYRDPFNAEIDPNAEVAEELAEFKVSNAMKLTFNNKTDDFICWFSLYSLLAGFAR